MAFVDVEFEEEEDSGLDRRQVQHFSEAVLHSADWTVETIVSQLTRSNIEMNPRFQRRDAWSRSRKSTFIESLILGLPVPQIVLAEKQGQRGKYIVLDGKQRLLSLLQFTGNAEGNNNNFRLSGLEARSDLLRKRVQDLAEPQLEPDYNAFLNYTIRTVVIRNWPDFDFLHLVFLRLNTGSVKLSPQELRQAMFPGDFSDYVDDSAAASQPLQALLGRESPDPRMRDVELLTRYLSFQHFLSGYTGRMKDFLDTTCNTLNDEWEIRKEFVFSSVEQFNEATSALIEIFGIEQIARKSGSRSFNRAIFDALIFYAANPQIRAEMMTHQDDVRRIYASLIADADFIAAAESDTAGVPNTLERLRKWGALLRDAIGVEFNVPSLRPADELNPRAGIDFDGFGV
ncbi:hypothetical protein M728_001907 [Ensifer sp. WSM1721]|uniref:DUF262 domain-containing protein n=1 Tax=Ensifer sp. WSM1721 TaxID=1041159 RepID=UPI0004BB68FD|nr:DUF262 domain-containing protein [Ensifer sp. WSM1721]